MISKTVKLMLIALLICGLSDVQAQERHSKRAMNPEQIFKTLDTDESGAVSLDEFKSTRGKDENKVKRLEDHFKMLDTDTNGELVLEEFVAKQKMTKEERMKERFGKIDTNGNGDIDFEEYSVFVEQDLERRSHRRPKHHKSKD